MNCTVHVTWSPDSNVDPHQLEIEGKELEGLTAENAPAVSSAIHGVLDDTIDTVAWALDKPELLGEIPGYVRHNLQLMREGYELMAAAGELPTQQPPAKPKIKKSRALLGGTPAVVLSPQFTAERHTSGLITVSR